MSPEKMRLMNYVDALPILDDSFNSFISLFQKNTHSAAKFVPQNDLDERLKAIEEKIDRFIAAIDYIFATHVLIKGKWVDTKQLEGK